MSFQKVLRPLVVCSALFAATQGATAQSKVAVISLQKALFETAEIKKADADMQTTLMPRQAQGRKLQEDLAAITQKLQGDPGKLTPQAEFDLNAEGKRKQVELTRIQEDLQADAEKMRTEVLSKSSDKMQAIVKKLAEEKGYDLVVDTQVALFFKPAMDITGDATAAYDKAYPVPPAVPPAKK
jgi:outer membrane protein